MPVVGVAAGGERRHRHDRDDTLVGTLLLFLNLLVGLADHHRPAADRIVVDRRAEVLLRVDPGFAAGTGLRGRRGRRRRLGASFQFHRHERAVGAELNRQPRVDRRGVDALAVDKQAVAAPLVADPPEAVAERHHDVLAADVTVFDPHVAAMLAPDMERAREAERAPVFRAHAQRRNGERTGCVPGYAHVR